MVRPSFLSLSVVCVLQLSADAQQNKRKQTSNELFESLLENPCRVWLGPSSLSSEDQTKLGLYAGVDFQLNQSLSFLSELAIPLVDFLEGPFSFVDEYIDILKSLESALWTGDYAGAAKFEGNYSSTLLVGGLGSLSNYHSAYSNIDWVQASAMLNLESTDVAKTFQAGKAHPARGSMTPYENLTMKATQDIPAGMELFANFGDVWDDEASKISEDIFEQRILKSDYAKADKLVDKVVQLLSHPDITNDAALKEDTLDLVLELILPAAGGKRAKAIRSLIPATSRKLSQVQAVGTFRYRHDGTMIKSNKWLRKNAVCVDTMTPGMSTIPNAGRGAFATRNFKPGDRITITPLLPIYEDVMQMYGINSIQPNDEEYYLEFNDEYLGQQILTNYAFGHPHSTLLLVPTSPLVTLVNHGGSKSANVMMEWADHEVLMQNAELHGKTLKELRAMDPQPNFLMQLVATRHIAKGEEILMDYGIDWEDAYADYLKKYNARIEEQGDAWQLKAEDVQRTYRTQPYPVNLKRESHPYPEGVMTACFLQTADVEDGTPKTTARGYTILRWVGPSNYDAYQGHDLVICDLMARTEDETDLSSIRYTVNTRLKGSNDIVQVVDVPHSAIVVVSRPYSSDMHARGAFRRWIGMRDEIFPQAWRLRELFK